MRDNKWLRLLAYVTGLVNQELLLQNEYLTAETGSCDGTCRRDCVCPIPKGPRSPRSASDSDPGLWRKWPVWPSQPPFWPGIAG